ncbi:unnamed protein product [Penicillium roqueforti FM164]|uniref:Genomic scaffold, ProqFM164S02 n=1 Tax=Penicillium roqueforti (strain FM164) TaxID=1365484 RepID=W6QE90_PENRF|nr:unnamed protein product [Penicillium roqueforti FM164]
MATIVHRDLSRHTGTNTSGPTPSSTRNRLQGMRVAPSSFVVCQCEYKIAQFAVGCN